MVRYPHSVACPKSLTLALLGACLGFSDWSARRAGAAEAAELLPSEAAVWLNSPPLTVDALKGKGVFLWFFEETCPTCRGKWPGLYELARRFEGQPVVFIAVNSGNSPVEVA